MEEARDTRLSNTPDLTSPDIPPISKRALWANRQLGSIRSNAGVLAEIRRYRTSGFRPDRPAVLFRYPHNDQNRLALARTELALCPRPRQPILAPVSGDLHFRPI